MLMCYIVIVNQISTKKWTVNINKIIPSLDCNYKTFIVLYSFWVLIYFTVHWVLLIITKKIYIRYIFVYLILIAYCRTATHPKCDEKVNNKVEYCIWYVLILCRFQAKSIFLQNLTLLLAQRQVLYSQESSVFWKLPFSIFS